MAKLFWHGPILAFLPSPLVPPLQAATIVISSTADVALNDGPGGLQYLSLSRGWHWHIDQQSCQF
jgi:hypothetical protein